MGEFASWLRFVDRWPAILRWTLLLPIAALTTVAWALFIGFFLFLIGMGGDPETRGTVYFGRMLAEVVMAGVFMLAGAYVAPRQKLGAGLTLGAMAIGAAWIVYSHSGSGTTAQIQAATRLLIETCIGATVGAVWLIRDAWLRKNDSRSSATSKAS